MKSSRNNDLLDELLREDDIQIIIPIIENKAT